MIKNGMVNALNNFIMVNYILKVNIWMEKLDWERIYYNKIENECEYLHWKKCIEKIIFLEFITIIIFNFI